MTKEEKRTLHQAGKIILRAQHDGRKNCWKIAKMTLIGGWSRFGSGWYITREDADRKIREICERDPKYVMDH